MSQNNSSRSKWSAILIAAMAFAMLISFVYAFIQQARAKEQTERAIQIEHTCREHEKNYEDQLNQQLKALEIANERLQVSLIALQESKRKNAK